MGYKKGKESTHVAKARKRLSGMVGIDTNRGIQVEYGDAIENPCNSTVFKDTILEYDTVQSNLNQTLAAADSLKNELIDIENKIKSYYKRALSGAISKYGENSSEVEMMGGKRKSERKKPVRKPKQ
jgi:hypothetical protein